MGKYFGTDGFRGEAGITLTADHAYKVGRFLGWYYNMFRERNGDTYPARIVIGKDTRRSSYMFEYSLVAGLTASGADAYLHVTTTPSVAYIARVDDFDCGIMISASHNPYYDNGIKLIDCYGEKMPEEILLLVEDYIDGKLHVFDKDWLELPFVHREHIGCTVDYVSGRNRYMGYLISLGIYSFKGVKVGLDCANGSSWNIAKSVFDALGADTYVINAQPNGLNINNNAGSTHIESLQKFVVENGLDVGFAFDGDADRCLCVDEKGNVITGDHILYIYGCYMKERGKLLTHTVVTTVMSNFGLYTGQNYDYNLNGVFFRDLELADPEVYLNAVGADLGETMGNIIAESYRLMVAIQPDAVLVLGDTNSCLSVIGAKRLHIPIFHMEAGNRCKDECLPEETNRRIVDIISDVNMAYSEHARRYLADCGLPRERTYVTGSPMAEVLHQNLAKIEASDIHARLGLEKGGYILLSAHREENIDTEKNFNSLFTAINKMAEKYDMPILYSCHPRSRKRLEQSGFQLDKRVIQHEPLGFHDYNCLQMNAFCVVSDSGTLPEESSFFTSVGHPFPAVCIRTSTERPEALDKGCFILAGIDEKSLLQAVDTAVEMNQNGDYGIPVPDYVDENVSDKVVKIIQSYTGVVNKMVWRKG